MSVGGISKRSRVCGCQVFKVLDVGVDGGCLLNPSEGGVVILINLFVETTTHVVAEVSQCRNGISELWQVNHCEASPSMWKEAIQSSWLSGVKWKLKNCSHLWTIHERGSCRSVEMQI